MQETEKEKQRQSKTGSLQLQQRLKADFEISRRIAEVIVSEAEACLVERHEQLVSGLRWVLLARREAGHSQPLVETALKQVCWTIDNRAEDAASCASSGAVSVRSALIQRLLDEAVE